MSLLPSVSIIVLNWNSSTFLAACLDALQQLDYPTFTVTLVDNASTDDSILLVQNDFPAIECVQNPRNLGYGGGNNVALRRTQADIAVIINPDVVVERGWLRALVTPMVEDATVGVTGCKLIYPDSQIIQHAGGYITRPQAFPGHYGLGETDQGQWDQERDVDYLIGAAIALRRTMLDQVGDFDEGYFLYFEEADLCRRALDAGFRVVYVPDAVATHVEAATTEKESDFYLKQIHSGRWRYLLKHAAPEELLERTFPAEQAWLHERSPREWKALSVAYRKALHQMPEIWQTRRREAMDNETILTEEEEQRIEAGVAELDDLTRSLRSRAFVRASVALDEENLVRWSESDTLLQAKSYVVEEPFTSSTPVIGPLLTRFRTFWNNIATTWYVRPLTQQQNEYNHQVWERLHELRAFQIELYETIRETHALLDDLSDWLIESDRDTTRLARQSGELAYRLMQLEDQLAASTPASTGRSQRPQPDPRPDQIPDEQGG